MSTKKTDIFRGKCLFLSLGILNFSCDFRQAHQNLCGEVMTVDPEVFKIFGAILFVFADVFDEIACDEMGQVGEVAGEGYILELTFPIEGVKTGFNKVDL